MLKYSALINLVNDLYKTAKEKSIKPPKDITVRKYANGYVLIADTFNAKTLDMVHKLCDGKIALLATDPPYGQIVSDDWDDYTEDGLSSSLIWLMKEMGERMEKGTCTYLWGGVGKYQNRPFLKFALDVEHETKWFIKNWITFSKKRAIGAKWNYLFTREECLYLINDSDKPNIFNIPLLDKLRGYSGFNPKYKAKSDYLRRTNVWTDITELFRHPDHPTEKPIKLFEIPIEVHTKEGDWVVDLFAGSGTCAVACENTKRKFVVVEMSKQYAKVIDRRLGGYISEEVIENEK